MKREDIRKILNYPSKPLLLLALELVNLKNKELKAIKNVDIKGFTEQETAEMMECSIRSISYYRSSAYKKMAKAWEGKELIIKMLKGYLPPFFI